MESYREVRHRIREVRPDVVDAHNFFPLISPSVYYAAEAEGVPVVQTLHNYRLICPSANFFRDGKVCEECAGKAVPWPGVVHGCYRNSRPATGAVAAMIVAHKALSTWKERVAVYVALSEFSRRKFLGNGFPPEKIVVKPNFLLHDPGPGDGRGGFALFAGRLVAEKGIDTMLRAWQRLRRTVPLKVIGQGPLQDDVARVAGRIPSMEALGRRTLPEVCEWMGQAAFVVFPSECYEAFGRVVIESFSRGTPVIASDIGAASELVDHGRTGLLFRAGDAEDLAAKIEWALSHPSELAGMRREARLEFEAKYTAERNYSLLMDIYERAIRHRRSVLERPAEPAQDPGRASGWDKLLGRGPAGD